MTLLTMHDFLTMAPHLVLVGGAVAVLISQLILRRARLSTAFYITLLSLLATFGLSLIGLSSVDGRSTLLPAAFGNAESVKAFEGSFIASNLSAMFIALFCVIGLVVAIFMRRLMPENSIHFAENYFLLLIAIAGFAYAITAEDFITLFVAIEMGSLPLIVLAGINRDKPAAGEAAIKYLLSSIFATALILFGMALLYGATGTLRIDDIRKTAYHFSKTDAMRIGWVFVFAGLFFKVSAFRFHAWVADVYEGSLTIISGLMAALVKVGAFAILFKMVLTLADVYRPFVAPGLFIIAALSQLYGSFASLTQTNLKRLFAYSSIAHAGFLLSFANIPSDPSLIGVFKQEAGGGLIVYLFAYSLSVLLAFIAIAMMESDLDHREPITLGNLYLAGKRNRWAKYALTLSTLSLLGMPPLAGFFAKFYTFKYLLFTNQMTLALTVALSSGIGVYAYFRVIQKLYLSDEKDVLEINSEIGLLKSNFFHSLILKISYIALFTFIISFALFVGFVYHKGYEAIQKIMGV